MSRLPTCWPADGGSPDARPGLELLLNWLTIAALADWLIARTVTRLAIFMPKPPLVIGLYQVLTAIGQLAYTVAGLLTLAAMVWIAWELWRARRARSLALVWLSLVVLSVTFVLFPPAGWLAAAFQLLTLLAIGGLGGSIWTTGTARMKAAWLSPALALVVSGVYQLMPAAYTALRWPGPAPFTGALFNLGELLAVLTPLSLWWARGRASGPRVSRHSLGAAIPALVFVVAHFADPAMTAIIAIWSTGLTLYLPWPLYAFSLWLGSIVVISTWRQGDRAGRALLLLAAGGYAAPLSTQVFLGLIALWLLAELVARSESAGVSDVSRRRAVEERAPTRRRQPGHGLS